MSDVLQNWLRNLELGCNAMISDVIFTIEFLYELFNNGICSHQALSECGYDSSLMNKLKKFSASYRI